MYRVRAILIEQEYDTDAIEQDYDELQVNTNIREYITQNGYKQNRYSIIRNHVMNKVIHSYTLQNGILYDYWKANNFNGTIQVTTKYFSLKEEMLGNAIYSLPSYQFHALLRKVTKYMHSYKVKKIKSYTKMYKDIAGIAGTPISSSHLLSVVIYCCCTDLCTAFRSTFRRNEWNETNKSVMRRNMEFANMSRLLFETIYYYGYVNDIHKSFYCGVSKPMVLTGLAFRPNSPLSTSQCIEVAQRFGSSDGMVIECKNGLMGPSSFSTSWISDYGEENEHLFGPYNYIENSYLAVSTIILQRNAFNFKRFIEPLLQFCKEMMGKADPWHRESRRNSKIINDLIEYELRICKESKHPKYIHQAFFAIIHNATESEWIELIVKNFPKESYKKLRLMVRSFRKYKK